MPYAHTRTVGVHRHMRVESHRCDVAAEQLPLTLGQPNNVRGCCTALHCTATCRTVLQVSDLPGTGITEGENPAAKVGRRGGGCIRFRV